MLLESRVSVSGVNILGLTFGGCTWQWRLPSHLLVEDIGPFFWVKSRDLTMQVSPDDDDVCALLLP